MAWFCWASGRLLPESQVWRTANAGLPRSVPMGSVHNPNDHQDLLLAGDRLDCAVRSIRHFLRAGHDGGQPVRRIHPAAVLDCQRGGRHHLFAHCRGIHPDRVSHQRTSRRDPRSGCWGRPAPLTTNSRPTPSARYGPVNGIRSQDTRPAPGRWWAVPKDENRQRARLTESFLNEQEAKEFAKAKLSEGLSVRAADTLNPHQPKPMIVPAHILNGVCDRNLSLLSLKKRPLGRLFCEVLRLRDLSL